MRRYGRDQTDQGEFLDDCCHMNSASGLSACDFCFRNSPFVTLLHFFTYKNQLESYHKINYREFGIQPMLFIFLFQHNGYISQIYGKMQGTN